MSEAFGHLPNPFRQLPTPSERLPTPPGSNPNLPTPFGYRTRHVGFDTWRCLAATKKIRENFREIFSRNIFAIFFAIPHDPPRPTRDPRAFCRRYLPRRDPPTPQNFREILGNIDRSIARTPRGVTGLIGCLNYGFWVWRFHFWLKNRVPKCLGTSNTKIAKKSRISRKFRENFAMVDLTIIEIGGVGHFTFGRSDRKGQV